MTFEEFQATGRDCDDLGAALSDCYWDDEPVPGSGRLYLDSVWIERRPTSGWPDKSVTAEWFLLLGRDSWVDDNLTTLERMLYEFAISEGYLEDK